MAAPKKSGIYLVTLTNSVPISVNADRPDISERCIKVNSANCKVGRAENLARREEDYRKTFGSENVVFEVLCIVDQPAILEGELLSKLHNYRIRGKLGHLNEWLAGVEPEEVKQLVSEVIKAQSQHRVSPSERSAQPSVTNAMDHLDATDPKETVRLLRILIDRGFLDIHFRTIHHKNNETINSHLKYCEKTTVFRINSSNAKVQLRLRFIAQKLEKELLAGIYAPSRIFNSLAHQAVNHLP